MKKIILSLIALAMTTSLFAANAAERFNIQNTQLGGIIGDTIVFIYKDNEASVVTDKTKLKLMSRKLEQQLCSDQSTRDLIVNNKFKVLFIYPTNSLESVNILSVDSCSH